MAKKHREEADETVTISKVAIWQVLTLVFAILFVISLFTGGFGIKSTTKTGNTGAAPTGNTGEDAGNAPNVEITLDGAQILGDENAPVTIIEWSDFQCPFCGRHSLQTQPSIVQNYVDAGKVKIVFKHFPLDSIHPQATPAALASECAGEQGKFWEFHDLLFENQGSLSVANYKKWAADLSLDTAKFNSCLDDQKYADKVKADLQEGLSAGIRGTPGFLVNGQLVSGAQPYAVFESAIEAALN